MNERMQEQMDDHSNTPDSPAVTNQSGGARAVVPRTNATIDHVRGQTEPRLVKPDDFLPQKATSEVGDSNEEIDFDSNLVVRRETIEVLLRPQDFIASKVVLGDDADSAIDTYYPLVGRRNDCS